MKVVNVIKNFINESVEEFKKVQWPDKKQTIRLTAFVVGVSLIVGIYVSGLDLGFKKLLSEFIK